MTQDQDTHLFNLMTAMNLCAESKYRRGAQEHKNDLLAKTPVELLVETRDELIDAFIYVQTAIVKLHKLDALIPKKKSKHVR